MVNDNLLKCSKMSKHVNFRETNSGLGEHNVLNFPKMLLRVISLNDKFYCGII